MKKMSILISLLNAMFDTTEVFSCRLYLQKVGMESEGGNAHLNKYLGTFAHIPIIGRKNNIPSTLLGSWHTPLSQ